MTLGEMRERAAGEPAEVKLARAEAVAMLVKSIEFTWDLRERREERPFIELGVIDLGGEAGGA